PGWLRGKRADRAGARPSRVCRTGRVVPRRAGRRTARPHRRAGGRDAPLRRRGGERASAPRPRPDPPGGGMTRAPGLVALTRRRMATPRSAALVIVALTLLASFLIAAAPRTLAGVVRDEVAFQLDQMS